MKKSNKNNEFKISAPTWNDKFELPDRLHSVSDIQDDFRYIIKKRETVTDDLPIKIYINNIAGKITFRIRTGYYLILSPETIKLFGSTKSKISKSKWWKCTPFGK